MAKTNYMEFLLDMKKWGFEGSLDGVGEAMRNEDSRGVHEISFKQMDFMSIVWEAGFSKDRKRAYLDHFRVDLQKHMELPDELGRMDIKGLVRMLENITGDATGKIPPFLKDERRFVNYAHRAMENLVSLHDMSLEGSRIHSYLMNKYVVRSGLRNMFEDDYIETIKSEHRRKLIVDVKSSHAVNIDMAYNLLDGRFVQMPAIDGVVRWGKVDLSIKDVNGVSAIQEVIGSEGFDLKKAIDRSMIHKADLLKSDSLAMRSLSIGDRLTLAVDRDGQLTRRAFYADPERGRLAIDMVESQKRGLLSDLSRHQGKKGGEEQAPPRGRKR